MASHPRAKKKTRRGDLPAQVTSQKNTDLKISLKNLEYVCGWQEVPVNSVSLSGSRSRLSQRITVRRDWIDDVYPAIFPSIIGIDELTPLTTI